MIYHVPDVMLPIMRIRTRTRGQSGSVMLSGMRLIWVQIPRPVRWFMNTAMCRHPPWTMNIVKRIVEPLQRNHRAGRYEMQIVMNFMRRDDGLKGGGCGMECGVKGVGYKVEGMACCFANKIIAIEGCHTLYLSPFTFHLQPSTFNLLKSPFYFRSCRSVQQYFTIRM